MRPLRFLRLTPSLLDEGKCIFFESSTLKFFSNSSIIQKISVTLSLVIIAYIICNYLIFTYKDTKYLRDYQFLCVFFIQNSRIAYLLAPIKTKRRAESVNAQYNKAMCGIMTDWRVSIVVPSCLVFRMALTFLLHSFCGASCLCLGFLILSYIVKCVSSVCLHVYVMHVFVAL